MSKSEKAKQLFCDGYNCSQAVLGAFCEDLGMNFETAMKLSSSFGGGMGRLREVCGAVSGMFMIAGMKCGYSDPNDKQAKTLHYTLIQKLAEDFKNENGSIICRELLDFRGKHDVPVPADRTPEYYKSRSCLDCIASAVKIIEKNNIM